MPRFPIAAEGGHADQLARFVVNGLVAAAVHFSLLYMNVEVFGMQSAGLANLAAAIGGVTCSFLGNRYYVFRVPGDPMLRQALRFGFLYAAIALVHGAVLFLWTDIGGRDYRQGFLLATAMQVVLSYAGNKLLVFRR